MSEKETLANVQNSLSYLLNPDNNIRKEHEALLKALEDTNTPLLLHCLMQLFQTTTLQTELRYITLIFLKNVINRKWQFTCRKLIMNETQSVGILEEFKPTLRLYLLVNYQNSDQKPYIDQLLEIIGNIARHDFSSKWPELVSLFYYYIDKIKMLIPVITQQFLSPSDMLNMQKGINLIKKVLKDQTALKFRLRKCEFVKIAPQLIQALYEVNTVSNKQFESITANDIPNNKYLPQLIEVCSEFETIIIFAVINGFNPSDLIGEDASQTKGFQYVMLIEAIVKKVLFYSQLLASCVSVATTNIDQANNIKTVTSVLCKSLKHLILALTELQVSEPVLLMNCFKEFLQTLYSFVTFPACNINEELSKTCLFGLCKVFDTVIYSDDSDQSKLAGLIASPSKIKLFDKHFSKARAQYKEFFNFTTLSQILTQIVSKYMIQKDYEKLLTNQEEFAEEDEDLLNVSNQANLECTITQLSYMLMEQVSISFNQIATTFFKTQMKNMSNTNFNTPDLCLIEDATLHGLQALPYAFKIRQIVCKIEIEEVLNYIEMRLASIDQMQDFPFLKLYCLVLTRRYSLLLRSWFEFIDRTYINRGKGGQIHHETQYARQQI